MTASSGGGFGYLLMHTAQTWRTEATVVLQPFGLTVPQFLVVTALYRQHRHGWPPLKQSEVAERLGMDANTTSQVVRGLERRGILIRSSHAGDARAFALSLTHSGVDRAVGATAAARQFNDRYFGALSPAQLAALGEALEILGTESEKRA